MKNVEAGFNPPNGPAAARSTTATTHQGTGSVPGVALWRE
jgi:hypothetical protein